jgi:hypothetical protein
MSCKIASFVCKARQLKKRTANPVKTLCDMLQGKAYLLKKRTVNPVTTLYNTFQGTGPTVAFEMPNSIQ